VPVEYKRGIPKRDASDRVQLCAQAMCLEEAFGRPVPEGAIYYARLRRRVVVPIDAELRELTIATAARAHRLLAEGRTPPARREPKCEHCSLLSLCLPDAVTGQQASSYLTRSLKQALEEPGA
jgi:CRISPR-associated exonuclease Cas4